MKVIGTAGDGKYLCEVNHTEIEKFLGTYYGNTSKLRVGQEIDLGKGYDYHKEIIEAFDKTQKFIDANKSIISAIISGLRIVGTDQQPVGE